MVQSNETSQRGPRPRTRDAGSHPNPAKGFSMFTTASDTEKLRFSAKNVKMPYHTRGPGPRPRAGARGRGPGPGPGARGLGPRGQARPDDAPIPTV